MKSSWIFLDTNNTDLNLSPDLKQQDAFGARDVGWVEQMRYIVKTYTRPEDLIVDPFCGFATTLVAAAMEGRKAVGLEIEPQRVQISRERLRKFSFHDQTVVQGDATQMPFKDQAFDFVATSLPYFGLQSKSDFSSDKSQLYAHEEYKDYLEFFKKVFVQMHRVLKNTGRMAVVAENIRLHGAWMPLAWDLARLLTENFRIIDERVFIYPEREDSKDESEMNQELVSARTHEYLFICEPRAKA